MVARIRQVAVALLAAVGLQGCAAVQPIPTVAHVDLERFMGDWYVVASIPTPFEKAVYNGVETYRLADNGTVETTFTFNKGSYDGPRKTYRSRGFVYDDPSNAHWGIQFVWPFKAEYRIVHLADDYSRAVIGRTKRDYLWIMSRERSVPAAEYERILAVVSDLGYDISRILKVPQQAAAGK